MRRLLVLAVLTGVWVLPTRAEAPDERWATRADHNAARAREAAVRLADTARSISAAGRVHSLAPLRADVEELVRLATLLASQTSAATQPSLPIR